MGRASTAGAPAPSVCSPTSRPAASSPRTRFCAAAGGVSINGTATGILIRGNVITPRWGVNPTATAGVRATGCNFESPWVFDNADVSGIVSSSTGQPSYGIVAGGGCNLRIDHNLAINGSESGDGADTVAIWCQRDAGTLRESRCQIVANKITSNKGTAQGPATAVRCDDLSCARIEDNIISGGNGGSASVGVTLARTGTLVARNTIDSGCMTGGSPVSVALDTTNSFARIENNLVKGSACGGQVYGVREHVLQSGNEVDLHSNTISGGGVAAGCTGHALTFDVGATSPASARGLVRNNILVAGPCASTAVDLFEAAAMASPRVLANNDLAPAPILYHSNGGGDLTTIGAVNALAGAAANFSADPMLNADGVHLNTGSMCIDSGTALGAPAEDYDAMSRPSGAGFDVGADEK